MINVVFFDLGDTLVRGNATWIPGARDVLTALRAEGVRLGIISNTGQWTRPQILAHLPADFHLQLFEPGLVLFSSETGIEKPALEVFQLAVERGGVSASECLFCTENLPDSLAAQRAGMMAARVAVAPRRTLAHLAMSCTPSAC